jgi:signal recognition particle subunit SEC65
MRAVLWPRFVKKEKRRGERRRVAADAAVFQSGVDGAGRGMKLAAEDEV